MLRVGIVGATGYAGGELLRLLSLHPNVKVVCVTSGQSVGKDLIDRQPFLKGHYHLELEALDPMRISGKVDFLFVALSHTDAMTPVAKFIGFGKKVVDLSADYRIRSVSSYEKWYGRPHLYPSLVKKSVYGLSEVYRKRIASAMLVANPGCYPTGALLPMVPFLEEGLIDGTREIIIDAKSGISGAGRSPSEKTHFPTVNDALTPYNIGSHRHLPEIVQEVRSIGKTKSPVLFTPYLLPVNRGLLTTVYLPLNKKMSQRQIDGALKRYKNERFIRIVSGSPSLSHVRGTNYCDIGAFSTASGRTALLISAIDNLGKGAAGQAIQNMNIMMGWSEETGLFAPGIFP